MILLHQIDAMFCFYCATLRKKGTLVSKKNIKDAYTTKGFSSWKKSWQCFKEHQQTHCHRSAALHFVVIPECKDVGEMTKDKLFNVRGKERKYLFT